MRIYNHLLFLLTLMAMLLVSCDDVEVFVPYTSSGDYLSLKKEFTKHSDFIRVNIDPRYNNVIENNKSILDIPKNVVQDANNLLFQDECLARLIGSTEKYNLIMNDISTSNDESLFEFDHYFNLKFTKNNELLSIIEGQTCSIKFAGDTTRNVNLYGLGKETQLWTKNTVHNLDHTSWSVLQEDIIGYQFEIQNDDWFAIGNELTEGMRKVGICANLPEYFNNKNTRVYVVFEDYNSIIKLNGEGSDFCDVMINKPFDAEFTIISLSVLGDSDYYIAMKEARVGKIIELKLVPEQKSIDEIVALLKEL